MTGGGEGLDDGLWWEVGTRAVGEGMLDTGVVDVTTCTLEGGTGGVGVT